MNWYVLDENREPRPATVAEWTQWKRTGINWIVGKHEFPDGVLVSTVFLGLDHSHIPGEPPVLFETMIFDGKWDQYQWRYTTHAEAVATHDRIVAALRAGEAPEGEEL